MRPQGVRRARDPLASALCIEELSKQCASTGDIVATHNGLCCDPIMTYGTEAQKRKYLPMLTKGHRVGAFALTEPTPAPTPPRVRPRLSWWATTT